MLLLPRLRPQTPPALSLKMASPNARIALRSSETFKKVPSIYQDSWLDHLEALGSEADRPEDNDIFEDEKHCLRRLNTWQGDSGGTHLAPQHRNCATLGT